MCGFTLIELLIVVAIIGILLGIVLVAVMQPRDKALVSSYKTTMQSTRTGIELCTGTGGTLLGGTRAVGTELCAPASGAAYAPLPTRCGLSSYIVNAGVESNNWSFTTNGTCGECRLVCDLGGCTEVEGECYL